MIPNKPRVMERSGTCERVRSVGAFCYNARRFNSDQNRRRRNNQSRPPVVKRAPLSSTKVEQNQTLCKKKKCSQVNLENTPCS